MTLTARPFRVVVVGGGPRGIATAHALLPATPVEGLEVAMIDPFPGGRVWRRDQDRNLLMNSRLRQATLFIDDSVANDLTIAGPTFGEWCADIAPALELSPAAAEEAAGLGPDDFASRALFGEYTRWAVRWLQERGLRLVRDEAVAVEPDVGGHTVVLRSGAPLAADAVVLALGHVDSRASERERSWADFARRAGLAYVPPGPAAEAEVEALPAGGDVAVLGTGLNFYDIVARTTLSRDGRFERDEHGRLRYVSSGAEPVLWVGSGRGVPYMARGLRPSQQRLAFLTPTRLTELQRRAPVDFAEAVWPDVVREMRHAWYEAAAADVGQPFDPAAVAESLAGLPAEGAEVEQWCARHLPGSPLDLEELLDPLDGLDDEESVREALLTTLGSYVAAARRHPVGPTTAVGERLAMAKNAVRDLVAAGTLRAASLTGDLQGWFRSVGGFVAAGPPLERVEQVLALMEADVVRPAGRGARVEVDEAAGVFRLSSATLAGHAVTGVVEARLPPDDLRHTSSELVHQLLDGGVARLAVLDDPLAPVPTGGLDVTRGKDPRPCRVYDRGGEVWSSIFALGISVQPLEWNIANLPLPGTGARTLVQARAIADQIHELAGIVSSAAALP